MRNRVWALLSAACLALALVTPASAELLFVTKGKSNRIVIFIDAIKRDATKAFRWGDGSASWPELMAADGASQEKQLPLSRYDTAILGFADTTEDHASVPQLAIRALTDLKARGVFDTYQSIVFVAHGAGGLVLKSMLVQSATSGSPQLATKSKAIFLLSVPAQGRPAANFLSALQAHEPLALNFGAIDPAVFLQGLESLWSDYLSKRGPTKRLEVYCRHESSPTFGNPVATGQYTTEGCDDAADDRAADQQSIARPSSRDAGVYVWVRKHLADYFQRFPSDPGLPKPAASSTVALATEGTTTTAPPSVSVEERAEAMTPIPPQPATPSPAIAPPAATAATAAPPPPETRLAEGSTLASPAAPGMDAGPREAQRGEYPRARPRPAHSGDWTFVVKGGSCNLATELWVVKVTNRHLVSDNWPQTDNWEARIAPDGSFVVNKSFACGTELVRGKVTGKIGRGTFFYTDPCSNTYCRAKFQMTWRHPVPANAPDLSLAR